MNEIIKAEIKKLTKKMNATTEMESHNYYRGKIAGLKLAIRLEPQVSRDFCDKCRFIDYYRNRESDGDWERWCMNPDSKHFDEKIEYGFCCKNFQRNKLLMTGVHSTDTFDGLSKNSG